MKKFFHIITPGTNNYVQSMSMFYDPPYYYAYPTVRFKEDNNKYTFRTHILRSLTGEDWKEIGEWRHPLQTKTYRPVTQPVSFLNHNDKSYAYFNHNYGFDGNVWVDVFEAKDHDYVGWKDTGVVLTGDRWIPTIFRKGHGDYVMMTYDGGVWKSIDGLGWNLVQQIAPKTGYLYCDFNTTYSNTDCQYIDGKWWASSFDIAADWSTLLRIFYSEDCYTWHLLREYPRDCSTRTLYSVGGWMVDGENVYLNVMEMTIIGYATRNIIYKSSIRNPGDFTDMGEWVTDQDIRANIPLPDDWYSLDGVYQYNGKFFYSITAGDDAWLMVTDKPAL